LELQTDQKIREREKTKQKSSEGTMLPSPALLLLKYLGTA